MLRGEGGGRAQRCRSVGWYVCVVGGCACPRVCLRVEKARKHRLSQIIVLNTNHVRRVVSVAVTHAAIVAIANASAEIHSQQWFNSLLYAH